MNKANDSWVGSRWSSEVWCWNAPCPRCVAEEKPGRCSSREKIRKLRRPLPTHWTSQTVSATRGKDSEPQGYWPPNSDVRQLLHPAIVLWNTFVLFVCLFYIFRVCLNPVQVIQDWFLAVIQKLFKKKKNMVPTLPGSDGALDICMAACFQPQCFRAVTLDPIRSADAELWWWKQTSTQTTINELRHYKKRPPTRVKVPHSN